MLNIVSMYWYSIFKSLKTWQSLISENWKRSDPGKGLNTGDQSNPCFSPYFRVVYSVELFE